MTDYAQQNPGLNHVGYRFPTPILTTQLPAVVEELVTVRFRTAVVTNRVVYVGNVHKTNQKGEATVEGDAMYKSSVNKFDTFADFRKIEASVADGDEIIKLEEYADRVLQFKKKKMHLINVSQEVEFLEETFLHKGVSSPASVCKTDYGIAWVNRQGCYLYDGEKVTNLFERKGVKLIKDSEWESFLTVESSSGDSVTKETISTLTAAQAHDSTPTAIYCQTANRPIDSSQTLDFFYGGSDTALTSDGHAILDSNEGIFTGTDIQGTINYEDGSMVLKVLANGAADGDVLKLTYTHTAVTATELIPIIGYIPKKRQLFIADNLVSAGPESVFIYDIITQSWVNGSSGTMPVNNNSNFVVDWNGDLVFGNAYSNIKYWDTSPALSTAVDIKTKDIDFGQPGQRKKIYKVYVTHRGSASNIQTSYAVDGDQDTYTEVGSELPATSAVTDWVTTELALSVNNCYSIRLRFFSDGTTPANFEINDISIVFRVKPVK